MTINDLSLSVMSDCTRTDEVTDVLPVNDRAHSFFFFSLSVVNMSLLSVSAASKET